MTEIADKIASSTDRQMKDITSVLVTAMPDHEKFDRRKMEFWSRNKKLLAAQMRHLLDDVPVDKDFYVDLKGWEKFYREVLKTKVDFSDIDVPCYGNILSYGEIVPVVAEITTQEIIDLLKSNFPTPFSIKGEFPVSIMSIEPDGVYVIPKRPTGHYGLLVRGGQLPDLDMSIELQDESDGKLERGDAAYTVVRSVVKNSVPNRFPEQFMSQKEYLLFAAFQVWHSRFSIEHPQWHDYDYLEGMRGTAFPFVFGEARLIPRIGCIYHLSGAFTVTCSVDHPSHYRYKFSGRRVHVLPSLRKA